MPLARYVSVRPAWHSRQALVPMYSDRFGRAVVRLRVESSSTRLRGLRQSSRCSVGFAPQSERRIQPITAAPTTAATAKLIRRERVVTWDTPQCDGHWREAIFALVAEGAEEMGGIRMIGMPPPRSCDGPSPNSRNVRNLPRSAKLRRLRPRLMVSLRGFGRCSRSRCSRSRRAALSVPLSRFRHRGRGRCRIRLPRRCRIGLLRGCPTTAQTSGHYHRQHDLLHETDSTVQKDLSDFTPGS